MAFCVNCGAQNNEGAKFCSACGKSVTGTVSQMEAAPIPRTTTVGQVKKCPSCGNVIETFQTRCSSCGFELGSKEASKTIKEFSNKIIEFDSEIAAAKGSAEKKSVVWWVILNIFTYCIPLLIRTIKRAFIPKIPPLIPSEQKKKSYIENFIVPNNREDILEFALYIPSRIENLLGGGIMQKKDERTVAIMWAKVWADKCRQVQSRVSVTMGDDKQTATQVNDLLNQPQILLKKNKKKELIKAIILAALLVSGLILYVVASAVSR